MRTVLMMMAAFLASCGATEDAPEESREPVSQPSRDGAPPPVPVEAPTTPYVFRGLAGDWGGVFIDDDFLYDTPPAIDDLIMIDSPTSAGWYSARILTKAIPPGGTVFQTETMKVTIEDGGCEDAPLRAELPDRVILDWDGGRHIACGGYRLDTDEVPGSVWMAMQVDGEAAPFVNPPAATLTFNPDGKISGTIDCNGAGADIEWRDQTFVVHSREIIQTEMGCMESPNDAFAQRFWSRMPDAVKWNMEDDKLTIEFNDGGPALLVRLL